MKRDLKSIKENIVKDAETKQQIYARLEFLRQTIQYIRNAVILRWKMKFKINNTEWTIKEVSEAEINNEMKNDFTLGVTIYKSQEILLLKDQVNIIKTLKHELMHVWMYEYGHRQDDEKKFDYEDICEIAASSNDFINEVVDEYKSKHK